MNIGAAATQSGVSAKTIRYYEEIGLLQPAPRSANGYRAYAAGDVHVLRFIQRARSLGFSVKECHQLLDLYQNPQRASSNVKALALHRVADIDHKIDQLQSMRATLVQLAEHCHGDERPDCPILDDLAAPPKAHPQPGST